MSRLRCSVRYYCISTLLMFVGTILICAFAITVLLPYMDASQWIPAVCHVVTDAVYNRQLCGCDQPRTSSIASHQDDVIFPNNCAFRFPCLQVFVDVHLNFSEAWNGSSAYSTPPSSSQPRSSLLLYRSWMDAYYATVTR